MSSQPPVIPDHELLRRIGSGSYGEVWLARSVMGAYRAVKIVYRKSFDQDHPYDREFAGIQKFEPISRTHESQVDILHVGRNDADGYFFYIMELADAAQPQAGNQYSVISDQSSTSEAGALSRTLLNTDTPITDYFPRTLKHDLRTRGALPVAECVSIGLSLTQGLAHLHGNGLVHRDIKPSNIIFVGGVPKLADIGLVTSVDATRSFVGTDGYIPPEGPGTPQADLYSLGKVLYEMSTGRDRQEFPELGTQLRASPDREQLLEFNEVILKACESDVHQRYQSAEEMHADLALLQKGKSVRQKRTNEQRWAVAKKVGLVLVVLAVVAVSAVTLRQRFTRFEYAGEGPPSTNDLATALCEKAMSIIRADDYARLAEAYTYFTNAIALDTNYARAYVGLFDLQTHLPVPGLPPATPAELRAIVQNLEKLSPYLAATHSAQSWMNYYDLDFAQAEMRILLAIEADPKFDPSWYGFMLAHWGRPEEARERLEKALVITPSLAINYRIMGHTYYAQREYTNAIAWYRQAVSWEKREVAAWFIGRAYQAQGDYTNAIASFAKREILKGADELATNQRYDELRRAFEAGDARGYWEEQWKRTEQNQNGDFYWKAEIQIRLGNTNAAFKWLNLAYETPERKGGQNDLTNLLFDECWDGVHEDPGFKELLEKTGFTKVMAKRKK